VKGHTDVSRCVFFPFLLGVIPAFFRCARFLNAS
jgi:hypothetical protein